MKQPLFPGGFPRLGLSILLWIGIAISSVSGAVPTVNLVNSGAPNGVEVPVTFGFAFAPGDIPGGSMLQAVGKDGTPLPIQTDVKATHPGGSLRHAVITLAADAAQEVTLAAAAPEESALPPVAEFLPVDFSASVELDLGGEVYVADAGAALIAAASSSTPWICGALVCEWNTDIPFLNGSNQPHPHLRLRTSLRAYLGGEHFRLSVTVENCGTFLPEPQGYTYDAKVSLKGEAVATYPGIEHSHHARWHQSFWGGGEPALVAIPDPGYLSGTGAVPNYDPSVQIGEGALASLEGNFAPMSIGDFSEYMPSTGAQDGIGPLPRWEALFALSGDLRAWANVLANGAAAGSFAVHYRDEQTGRPVLLDDYPYMTLLGNPSDTQNPNTGKTEAFPEVTNGLAAGTPDDAHQPSIGYLAYLLSGDVFYLEEMQFWANWNMLMANPGYRNREEGLLKWGQVRAQAWGMRSLGQAAYITPDAHPLKAYFMEKINNNITWYTENLVQNGESNPLGWLGTGSAFSYEPYGIAPWQDDFFTWAMGRLVELGFAEARPLAQWKSQFVVGRLTDPEYCWLSAPAYSVQVGPADRGSVYQTFGELYQANFSDANCEGLEMDGYPDVATGYGANMQPALAVAVDLEVSGAGEGWAKYETRDPRQDYSAAPQWALAPRTEPVVYAGLRNPGFQKFQNRGAKMIWDQGIRMFLFQVPGSPQWTDVRGHLIPGKPHESFSSPGEVIK